jgi:hypothetical protein
MIKSTLTAAFASVALASASYAADMPSRVTKPTPPIAASAACFEKNSLPGDVFGFTTGSDVADLGSWGAGLEYNGAYNTRFGSFGGHLAKAQVSTSFLRCLEVGPYVQGSFLKSSIFGLKTDSNTIGGGVEFKYKLLGRDVHGVGLTIVFDPNVNKGTVDQKFFGLKVGGGDFNAVNTTTRVLMDFNIAPRLFGAINLEHTANWTGDKNYIRSSGLNIRTALSYQVTEEFYLGAEASHQRAYAGSFLNRDVGNAWFVGPTFYWQATKMISLTGAYNIQVAGRAKDENFGLNLTNFNQHTAKLKLGISF